MPQTDSRKPLPFVSGLFPSDTPPDEQTAYDLQTKVVGNLFSQGFPALPTARPTVGPFLPAHATIVPTVPLLKEFLLVLPYLTC